jgi:DNA-binding transcriptional LysR family regulator
MKLHDLHVLMAAAQVGSMSKAAAFLNTGQPSGKNIAQIFARAWNRSSLDSFRKRQSV